MGNRGNSTDSSSHAESGWHLKEFTEGAVTIGVGVLSSKAPTRTLQNFGRRTSQPRLHWRNKKRGWGPEPILQKKKNFILF